jgi:hypothetical protein
MELRVLQDSESDGEDGSDSKIIAFSSVGEGGVIASDWLLDNYATGHMS